MAAITRHWSTVLNGSRTNEEEFEAQTDRILEYVREAASSEGEGAASEAESASAQSGADD